MTVRTIPTGESAVRVTAATGNAEADWLLVHKLARHLTSAGVDGVAGCIPTYESVLIEFDPLVTTPATVAAYVHAVLPALDLMTPLTEDPRHFRVPVVYGGELGPDLEEVARITGLSVEDVIRAHTAPRYVIRCLGSPGGSPMLDGPDLPVAVPRLKSPRTSVPQGAVSVAGRQATITPAVAPGGWCVIGRTPLRVLALDEEPLVPYAPGDTISFERIDAEEFHRLDGRRLSPEGSSR